MLDIGVRNSVVGFPGNKKAPDRGFGFGVSRCSGNRTCQGPPAIRHTTTIRILRDMRGSRNFVARLIGEGRGAVKIPLSWFASAPSVWYHEEINA